MLTVEIRNPETIKDGRFEVEIVCDEDGLNELKRQLTFLAGPPNHVHLATPARAGTGLDEAVHAKGNLIVNQLTIHKLAK